MGTKSSKNNNVTTGSALPPPVISAVSPEDGPLSGGISLTITGQNFIGTPISVTIGGQAISNLKVVSTKEITGTLPAGPAGPADLTVTTPQGAVTLAAAFTYHPAPTLNSITPDRGKIQGGTVVTINGSNFVDGKTTVTLGGNPVTIQSTTANQITGTTPSGTEGAVDLVVTTPGGSATLPLAFNYDGSAPVFGGALSAVPTSDTSIEVRWNQATDNLSDPSKIRYNIYTSTTSGNQNFAAPAFTSDGGALSFNIALLAPSTQYFIVVRAVDEVGNEDTNVVEVSALTLPADPKKFISLTSMGTPRDSHSLTLLPNGKVLALGGKNNGVPLNSGEIYDPQTGKWTASGDMLSTARHSHTATLLLSGDVLITGGKNGTSLNSAEIYHPMTDTFSTTTGSMANARHFHTATRLKDGRVLIVGGNSGGGALKSAEIYDPQTDQFSLTGSLNIGRFHHKATLLPDGRVLITGGLNGSTTLNSAEIYDPQTGQFTLTGNMNTGRFQHTATYIPTGKVLIAGGNNNGTAINSAELYDIQTNTFSNTGNLGSARFAHEAVLLTNGKVLIVAGDKGTPVNTAEVYNPGTATFSVVGSLSLGRKNHRILMLPEAKVLITGGSDGVNSLSSAIFMDSPQGSWSLTGSPSISRSFHTATLLPNEKVLIVGNNPTAELYNFRTGVFSTTGSMDKRSHHTATLLSNGKVLIAGGMRSIGSPLSSAFLYDMNTGSFLPTGGMTVFRLDHTATLLPNGTVLIAGGERRRSAEIYVPATGSFTRTGDMVITPYRNLPNAVLLQNGKVLVAGGRTARLTTTNTAELYDYQGASFINTAAPMNRSRSDYTINMLFNGTVLLAAGFGAGRRCEIYDPAKDMFFDTGLTQSVHFNHASALLPSGEVLISGYYGGSKTAEIYDPAIGKWKTMIHSMQVARANHTLTLLPNGKVLAVSGLTAELYDPGLGEASTWRPVITAVNTSSTFPVTLNYGSNVSISGFRFLGISGKSYPQIRLMGCSSTSAIMNSSLHRHFRLSAFNVTETSLEFTLPPSTNNPPGYYLLFVVVNGIPSWGKIVKVK